MIFSVYLIAFISIIPTLFSARTIRINNQCDQKLWFGIQGRPLIYSGGFDVEPHSTKDISVPDQWVREYILVLFSHSFYRRKADESGREPIVDMSTADLHVVQVII